MKCRSVPVKHYCMILPSSLSSQLHQLHYKCRPGMGRNLMIPLFCLVRVHIFRSRTVCKLLSLTKHSRFHLDKRYTLLPLPHYSNQERRDLL